MWKSFRRILESSFNSGKSSPSKPFAAIEKINNCGLHIEVKMVFMAEKTITVPEHFLLLFLLVVILNIFPIDERRCLSVVKLWTFCSCWR